MSRIKINVFNAAVINPITKKVVIKLRGDGATYNIVTTNTAKEFCAMNALNIAQTTDKNGVLIVRDADTQKELARRPILRIVKTT